MLPISSMLLAHSKVPKWTTHSIIQLSLQICNWLIRSDENPSLWNLRSSACPLQTDDIPVSLSSLLQPRGRDRGAEETACSQSRDAFPATRQKPALSPVLSLPQRVIFIYRATQ